MDLFHKTAQNPKGDRKRCHWVSPLGTVGRLYLLVVGQARVDRVDDVGCDAQLPELLLVHCSPGIQEITSHVVPMATASATRTKAR